MLAHLTHNVISLLSDMSSFLSDVFANEIGHACQSNLSNATMVNVNVLSVMIDISNEFKRCQILYNDDVNSVILNITVF